MRHSPALFLIWLACGSFAQAQPAPAVTELRYAGELRQRDAGGVGVPVRSFAMHAWVKETANGREIIARVDDEGRSGLAWAERIGGTSLAGSGEASGFRPSLRHVHLGRTYDLSLPLAVLASPALLEDGAEWRGEWEGRTLAFLVEGEKRVGSRECWEIHAASDIGRAQTLIVEKDSQFLVSAELRVFMGQGDRFDLTLKLEEEQPLDESQAAAAWELAGAMLALKEAESLQPAVDVLKPSAKGTAWERFLTLVESEAAAEEDRIKSLAALAAKLINQPAPDFTLTGLDGRPFDRSADKGQVVVLHFWEYRGEPESPFGQVGFLDFLASKRKQDGVQVYGVAVDERVADPQQRAAVQREVRKFSTQFMRLGYPIALDDGELLKKFGDPRPYDSPLPLWVVIGPGGKVQAHRAGLYNLDPNRGLVELDEAVTRACAETK
jgi:hypothetical protein